MVSEEQKEQSQESEEPKEAQEEQKVEQKPQEVKKVELAVVKKEETAIAPKEEAAISPAVEAGKLEATAYAPSRDVISEAFRTEPVVEKAVEVPGPVEVKPEEIAQVSEEKAAPSLIFAVKTTANQERAVANSLERRVKREKFDVRAILVPAELKGYILVETTMSEILDQAIATITHARSVVKGSSSFADVEHFLTPKPVVTGITDGAIIELIAGPFKGEKARVKRVDEAKEEITVELFEAMVPIPVTVRGDHVRILSKEETEHSLEKREKEKRR